MPLPNRRSPRPPTTRRVVACLLWGPLALWGACGGTSSCPTRYADADADGFGDLRAPVQACDAPGVLDATDCDDTRSDVHPGADERCDGLDDDCNGAIDDVDPSRVPSAEPRWLDGDRDGFGSGAPWSGCGQPPPLYTARNGVDCDDADPLRSPAADERCNGLDDNCNGQVDEDPVDLLRMYLDADQDGYGDDQQVVELCDRSKRYRPDRDAAFHWAEVGGDCDDGDSAVHPGAPEACNQTDDDCDGQVDEDVALPLTGFLDRDGDGYGAEEYPACLLDRVDSIDGHLVFVSSVGGDCDDDDGDTSPEAVELCNGRDDDCDGLVDDDDPDRSTSGTLPWHPDADGDGFGDPRVASYRCLPPAPTDTTDGSDCDDHDEDVNPSAEERCDGHDDDCDGRVDDLDDSLVGGPCP